MAFFSLFFLFFSFHAGGMCSLGSLRGCDTARCGVLLGDMERGSCPVRALVGRTVSIAASGSVTNVIIFPSAAVFAAAMEPTLIQQHTTLARLKH